MNKEVITAESLLRIDTYGQLAAAIGIAALQAMRHGVYIQPADFSEQIMDDTTSLVEAVETRVRWRRLIDRPDSHFFADLTTEKRTSPGLDSDIEEYDELLSAIKLGTTEVIPHLRKNGLTCLGQRIAVNKTYPRCPGAPMHVDAGVDISVGIMPNPFSATFAPSLSYAPSRPDKSAQTTHTFTSAIVGMRGPGRHRTAPRAMHHHFFNPQEDAPRHSVISIIRPIY